MNRKLEMQDTSENQQSITNSAENFFVNSACIGCEVCSQLAPDMFSVIVSHAVVIQQPEQQEDKRRAFHALLACPTAAIGSREKEGLSTALTDFPLLLAENVYDCGFTSAKSYGGHSYFIEHPDGNWLIDSPRFVPALAKKLSELGGVRTIFLTHYDDAEHADAVIYAKKFGAERIVHIEEQSRIGKQSRTSQQEAAEHLIKGNAPVNWHPDFRFLIVPGHTKGHMLLLYKGKYLFTGDHLFWQKRTQSLGAIREYCWYSWPEQVKSMERLAKEEFEWVLPRHGDQIQLEASQMKPAMERLLQHMNEID
ncbi:MBL fold metallo-hydrolase [Paenibacillus sepulcri]|uniref:MBL fold metallo-hydrolase n=1 Tax=Paenibacillus sepulcri TaxID=359917 RepID=A0ABS7BXA6_9BACL|nr:MBL fold metallo-hydrolase [Paenibacillus sepulcri]